MKNKKNKNTIEENNEENKNVDNNEENTINQNNYELEDHINEITDKDKKEFKKFAVKTTKAKRIKSILFWTLSASTIATVFGVVYGIKKPKNDYLFWKGTPLLSEDKIKEYIQYNKNYNFDITAKEFYESLILDTTINNKYLKEAGFKNLKDSLFSFEIHNIIEDTLNNSIHIDVLLKSKVGGEQYIILENLTFLNFKEPSEKYTIGSTEQKQLDAIIKEYSDKNFYYNKNKKEDFEAAIKKLSDEHDLINYAKIFESIFLIKGENKINNCPIIIKDLSYDKDSEVLTFKYIPIALSAQLKKIGKTKYKHYYFVSNYDINDITKYLEYSKKVIFV